MEDNKTYFGEIGHGLKTLAIGMKTSWKEYFKDFFTNKSTEQYPENRKTTLHVAKRHRGRLVFKRNEDGSYKCTACTLCEKSCPNGTIKIVSHMVEDPETGKKKKVLDDYLYDLGDCMFCQLCTNACNFDAVMDYIPGIVWFMGKTFFLVWILMWIKWTFPRLRIDQILKLEWKYLMPLALLNLVIMTVVVALGLYIK